MMNNNAQTASFQGLLLCRVRCALSCGTDKVPPSSHQAPSSRFSWGIAIRDHVHQSLKINNFSLFRCDDQAFTLS